MTAFNTTAEKLLNDPEHTLEYLQIWPGRGHKSFALIELANIDHSLVQSVVFEIDSFSPPVSRTIFCEDIWLNSLAAGPSGQLLALQVGRTVYEVHDRQWRESLKAEGLLNRVWFLDGDFAVAIGDDGLMYKWVAQSGWSEVMDGYETSLNDIHGLRRDELYVAASGGSLQRVTADAVEDLELPMELDFFGVNQGRDGLIRVCGEDGLCLETDGLEFRELIAPDYTFFSVAQFNGKTYWGAAEYGVFEQVGKALEPLQNTGMGYDLRPSNDFLYCSGSHAFWQFDGERWLDLRAVYDGEWQLRR